MPEPILAVAGRQIFRSDLPVIEAVVAAHRQGGVEHIAAALCDIWCWGRGGRAQVDGAVQVLAALAYRGLIQVPGWQAGRAFQGVALPTIPSDAPFSLCGNLSDFPPARLHLVEGREAIGEFDDLVDKHHYLGRRRVIGECLRYLVVIGTQVVAALMWGRAALKIGARDRLIGWSNEERRANIDAIANNYRFLVLPWVHIKYLASHVLAMNMRAIPTDWERRFGRRLRYLESFVDPERFQATSYLAANWIAVGFTQGSGRRGAHYHFHGSRKLVLLYPLSGSPRALPCPDTTAILRSRQQAAPPKTIVCHEGDTELVQALWNSIHFSGELSEAQLTELVADLNAYCAHFHDTFHRSELRDHFDLAMRSMLGPLEKKNVEYMALKNGVFVPVRTLQHFMSSSPWNDTEVRRRHQDFVAQTLGHPNGVLIIDGSDFAKKGKDSAGVARQYCGATGKIDNCQAGVFTAYAHPDGMATLVDGRLYLPDSWFATEQREQRWELCHIPADTTFKTKPELALEMIKDIHVCGRLPVRCILADEAFGANPGFLDGIPQGMYYFCEVPKTTLVLVAAHTNPEQAPPDGAEPVQVQKLVQDSALEWRSGVTLKEGAHGPIIADVARVRVFRTHKQGARWLYDAEVWLVIRRNTSTGELKYYLSSLPADASFDELIWLSAMRWPIETCFQEGKDYLGMDHYQVRSWTGWHHHMTMTFLTHHFLTLLRRRGKKKHLEPLNERVHPERINGQPRFGLLDRQPGTECLNR